MRQSLSTRYLYIVGRGYSGSTILSILIGQSSTVASEGEIISGFRDGYEARLCANREVFCDSPFWTRVRSAFERRAGTGFSDAVRLLHGRAHYARLIPNLLAPSGSAAMLEQKRLIEALYDSISEASDRPTVLDSSKEPAIAAFLLKHVGGARVIHMIRHPFGVVDSYITLMRSTQHFSIFRMRFRVKQLYVPMAVAAIVWTLENLFCELLRLIYPARIIRLHYEDLCGDPAGSLERLERFTGLSLAASKAAATGRLAMQPGHALSGNPMMRKKNIVFAPRMGATRNLTSFDKAIVTLCTFPLMLAYGYFGRRSGKSAAAVRRPELTAPPT